MDIKRTSNIAEWPTLFMIIFCYAGWAVSVTWLTELWLPFGIITTMIFIGLHSSLTHEAIHGHPFSNTILNAALLFPCLGLFIPYLRFRDLHLAHHLDSNLTDPYDDPESNFLDPQVWQKLPGWRQAILKFNNTLFGRMLVGPAISMIDLIRGDFKGMRKGDSNIKRAWVLHIPAVCLVLFLVNISTMPFWAYLIAAYLGFSLLKIRTYLEHQAHELSRARSVIIEDKGPLSWLFLNNNLHVVHHMHPNVPWYDLPGLYHARKERFQTVNGGYVYRSYKEIFARYLFQTKDCVPHPLWSAPDESAKQ